MVPPTPQPWAGLFLAAILFPASCFTTVTAAEITPGPGEAGLRAAVASAQDGDIILIKEAVELQSTLRVTNQLTFRGNGDFYQSQIRGSFEGVLIQASAPRVVFEGVTFGGSLITDGLGVEQEVVVRDGYFYYMREPVVSSSWDATLTLERVTVERCLEELRCITVQAKDCVFSWSADIGAVAWFGDFEGCRFEHNKGDGLSVSFGTVRDCVFRYNGDFGLRFDPDPGTLSLSRSLFYANVGGGLLLREEATAVVDNCTFTRHTGAPAVVVTEATSVLFRHCTVADNVVINPGSSPWYPSGNAFAIGFTGGLELQNCLIANNPTSTNPDAAGIDSGWTDGGGNIIGGDPGLSVLRDNGGATFTLMPLPGSPAIDAGRLSDIVHDARGLSRLAGAAPDAGAVETDAQPLADSDGDGIPDPWELFRALNPSDAGDASSDGDADGQNALAEFQNRTDPADPDSVLRCVEFRLAPAPLLQPYPRSIYLTWSASPGIAYELETSSDLMNWQLARVSFRSSYPENPAYPTGASRFLFFEVVADSAKAFFRLRTRVSPLE